MKLSKSYEFSYHRINKIELKQAISIMYLIIILNYIEIM